MSRLFAQSNLAILALTLLSSTTAADTLILAQRQFYDVSNGNRFSHTLLAPHDWKVEGQAFWPAPAFYRNPPSQQISASSPDGLGFNIGPALKAVEFRPNAEGQFRGLRKNEFQIESGAIVLYRPESLAHWQTFYEEKVIPQHDASITDCVVVDVFRISELKQVAEKFLQATQRQVDQNNAATAGMGVFQWLECDAIGIRTRFRKQGQPSEALQVYVVTTVITQGPFGHSLEWNVGLDLQFYGPEHQLDRNLPRLVTLANTVREVPSWTRFKSDHLATIDATHRQGIMDRARIHAEMTNAIMQMRHDSFMRRSRVSDRIHQRTVDSIREVEPYSQGGYQYELPAGYDYVYGDGQGNFILTDDAFFEPNRDINTRGSWTLVEPSR